MKSVTPLALTALLAVAAAVPLEKRDYATTTIIENVVETVDVYTTVWVQPGDPRLQQNQLGAAQNSPTSASAASTSIPSSSAAAYVPESNKEAAYVAPAPTSTPIATSTPAPAPPVTPTSTPAAVAKPEVLAAAPVQSSSATGPNPPTSPSSTADSGTSGGACGSVNGKCTGDVTTFDGGLGACGFDDATFTENYFALAHGMMGELSNTNKNCNRTAEIIYNGKTFSATLQDKCGGCEGASIDLSKKLFIDIFGEDTGRYHDVEWHFTS